MQQRSELPEGWTHTTFESITTRMTNGATITQNKDRIGFPVTRIETISDGNIDSDRFGYIENIDENNVDKYRLIEGDILFSHINSDPHLGKTAIYESNPELLLHGMNLLLLRPNKSVIYPYFLHYSCIYNRLKGNFISIANHAVNQSSINQKALKKVQISLPPLAEQHRIVAAIEALFARLNAANACLERVPSILKQFRQAVLSGACEGRLTEDWRAEHPGAEDASRLLYQIRKTHELGGKGHGGKAAPPTDGIHLLDQSNFPEPWTVSSLNWLCMPGRPITYGILKPGPDQVNGIPYIRVADFPNDKILVEGVRRTTKEIADNYKRSALIDGDVLLSIRGTVGRVCRVPSELEGANVTQDTARISVHELLSADYVEIYLRCPSVKKILDRCTKGVAIRGVNIGDVRALQVAIPPLPEQHEIVRRVDALFALADRIEAGVAAAREKTEMMRQSILTQAFSGRLVPTEAELARREGREYELASVLLERIHSEKKEKARRRGVQSTLV